MCGSGSASQMRSERGSSLCSPRVIQGLPRTLPTTQRVFELLVGPALLDLGPKFERATATSSAGWARSKMTPPECFLFMRGTKGGDVTPQRVGGAISSPDGRNDRCSHWDSALGSLGARVPPPRSHQRERLPSQPCLAKGQKHRRRRSYPPRGDAVHRRCRRSQSGSSFLHRYLDDCGSSGRVSGKRILRGCGNWSCRERM